MGTTYSVLARPTKDLVHDEKAKTNLAKKVDDALVKVNADMSTWIKDSDLSLFNAHSGRTPYKARSTTAKVVKRALEIAEQTDGAFDVTLGPLIRLWGFDRDGRRTAPPPADDVQKAMALVGWKNVNVAGKIIQKTHPNLEVNLSGIAKGYGVDEVVRVLRAEKMEAALVEVGGELFAFGEKQVRQKWRVGISLPEKGASLSSASHALELENRALATSGDYRNFFENRSIRYSHILDANTGAPVQHDLVSASIIAADCMTADGLATAMLVLGEKKGKALIESMPDVEAMFIRKLDEKFVVSTTSGFPTTTSFLPPSRENATY
ncbi:MAG: FAD:protein FMN transferase [Deltaproteobacteria bacterium]|nr:FAD:protein FMN transferase [Deltaproteobacteria bacterium]